MFIKIYMQYKLGPFLVGWCAKCATPEKMDERRKGIVGYICRSLNCSVPFIMPVSIIRNKILTNGIGVIWAREYINNGSIWIGTYYTTLLWLYTTLWELRRNNAYSCVISAVLKRAVKPIRLQSMRKTVGVRVTFKLSRYIFGSLGTKAIRMHIG